MKNKTLITMMTAFALSAAIMPINAEDRTTQVMYFQESAWEVSIPATTLSATQEVKQTVSATKMDIDPTKKLQVKITGINNGIVTLKRSGDSSTTSTTVSTTENSANPINRDTVIAEFEGVETDFANGTNGELYFSKVSESTKAGTYFGTITYVMETVNKSN